MEQNDIVLIIALLGLGTGLVHYIIKACHRSKCNDISICGLINIKRDVRIEQEEHNYDIEHNVRNSQSSDGDNLEQNVNNVQNFSSIKN